MPSPNELPMESHLRMTRRTHPKVRTGCLTCKTRRVKCDEAKPSCRRCTKVGLGCEGYLHPSKKNKKFFRFVPELAAVSVRELSALRPVCRSPHQAFFRNEQEHRYFKTFSDETADQLSGYFESELWNRLVLQACESTSSIRHAVIAIGALDLNKWKHPAKSPEEKLRRQFAYHQYSRAIKEMRDTISEGNLDLRTKLIAIILFICFEIYHGNSASAVAQIRAGSSMIEEQCREWNTNNSVSRPPPSIDNELLESFTELEIQAVTHSGYNMSFDQRERLNCRQNVLECMPKEFSTLRQARTTLHLIMMRQIHWTSERYGNPNRGCMMPTIMDDIESHFTEQDYLERDKRLMEFKAWAAAFEPLLKRARISTDDRLLKCATVLRITYLTCYLSTYAAMLNFLDYYYNQTHLLAEVITLIKTLGHEVMKNNEFGFSMNINLVVPLSLIAWRYRHRALRHEAIKLLLASPRREGLWDGVFIGKTAQWVAKVEEERMGAREIYVPHELATNVEVTGVDIFARTATLHALLKDRTSSAERVMKETKIYW